MDHIQPHVSHQRILDNKYVIHFQVINLNEHINYIGQPHNRSHRFQRYIKLEFGFRFRNFLELFFTTVAFNSGSKSLQHGPGIKNAPEKKHV